MILLIFRRYYLTRRKGAVASWKSHSAGYVSLCKLKFRCFQLRSKGSGHRVVSLDSKKSVRPRLRFRELMNQGPDRCRVAQPPHDYLRRALAELETEQLNASDLFIALTSNYQAFKDLCARFNISPDFGAHEVVGAFIDHLPPAIRRRTRERVENENLLENLCEVAHIAQNYETAGDRPEPSGVGTPAPSAAPAKTPHTRTPASQPRQTP
ncbi:hypothetical protein ACSSS7_007510 [Eimeria intestinalis]